MPLDFDTFNSVFPTSADIGQGFGTNSILRSLDDNDLSGFKATTNHWDILATTNSSNSNITNTFSSDSTTYFNSQSFTLGQNRVVEFDVILKFNKWRQFGQTGNTGDGTYKIQYLNLRDGTWTDWETDINFLSSTSWTPFILKDIITTNKLRVVCTANDSGVTDIVNIQTIYT